MAQQTNSYLKGLKVSKTFFLAPEEADVSQCARARIPRYHV